MAYQLIWSPAARDDLRHIVRFIAQDSQDRAETFGYRLIREVEKLEHHPELGRVVPEYRDLLLREKIVRSYRIVYRVSHEASRIEVVRIWHAARGRPEL